MTDGHWACVYCGNEVDEHGWDSRCCGEINHTEFVEDKPEQPKEERGALNEEDRSLQS